MGITTHRHNDHRSTPTTNVSTSTAISSVPSSTSTNTTATPNIHPFLTTQAVNSSTNSNAIDQHDGSIHSTPQNSNNNNNNNNNDLPFSIQTILSDQENERSRKSVAFSSVVTSKSVTKSHFQFESHSATNTTLRDYYCNVLQNAKDCLNFTASNNDSVLFAVNRDNDPSVTVPCCYYLYFNNTNNSDGINNNNDSSGSIPKSAASLFNPYHHPTVITPSNPDPLDSDSSTLSSHPITNLNTITNTKLISHSKTNYTDHNVMVASNYYDNVKNNDNTHQTHSYESDEEEDSDDTNVTISNTARKHSSPAIVSLPSTTSNIRRVGHPYQSRAPAKHKKPRTSFSKKQVALLEDRFLSQKYLASTERASLAIELDMSDAQVKTWFQNRRTKWRRQEAEEKEFEDKANARMLSSYRQCFFARPDITL